MTDLPTNADIPQNPAARVEWINARLAERGLSQAEVGRRCAVRRQSVQLAILYPTSARIDEALAELLDVPVQALFADRYGADGRRIGRRQALGRTQPSRTATQSQRKAS